MGVLAGLYLLIYNLLSDYIDAYLLLTPAIILITISLGQTVLFIIANLKVNREKRDLQLLTFKIFRLSSIIFYGPLYKSILQVSMIFGSNFKKKKSLVYLIFLFVFSGVFVSTFQIANTNIPYLIDRDNYFYVTSTYSRYYRTENEHSRFLLNPEIESDVVVSNTLKIFIPIFSYEKKMRKNVCGSCLADPSASESVQLKEKRAHSLACYHKYNLVSINGEEIKVEYLRYDHPITNQSGVICYLDMSNLKKGINTLMIKKKYGEDNISEWSIPFYFSPKD
jgi:hypothetical protein